MKFGVMTTAALLITSAAMGPFVPKAQAEQQGNKLDASRLRAVEGGVRMVDTFETRGKSAAPAPRAPVPPGDPSITFTSAIGAGQSPAGYVPLAGFGGTTVLAITDESIVNIATPQFLFGGSTYQSIGVVSNGYLVIGGGTNADVTFINSPIPSADAPNNILAPFWTDLFPDFGGRVLANVLTDGVDSWIVVEFEAVPTFDLNDTNTFQVWIGITADAQPGEDISFAYGPVGAGVLGAVTVGAENACGSKGTQVYFNGAGTLPVNGTEIGIGPAIDINCIDCNQDCVDDTVDPGVDCNNNGVPDECDLSAGASQDCNTNDIPDECDIENGTSEDCNNNAVPDECDIASGTSEDCNGNQIPDECDTAQDLFAGDALTCQNGFVITVPGTIGFDTNQINTFEYLQCGTQFSAYGAWLTYRPAWSGTFFMGIINQDTPFMINVFNDCPAGGVQIACNTPNPHGVSVQVKRGEIYYIRVAGVGLRRGNCNINLVGPRNLLSQADYNFNAVPDECDCLFDVNNDNVVDVMDFLDARQNEGMCMAFPCAGDVDGDGFVDEQDYMLILNNLGPCQFPRMINLGNRSKGAARP